MTQTNPSSALSTRPARGRVLAALTLLGALDALWALWLWAELVRSRAGGTPFCAFGASDCAALWDADFATAVHRLTGVPVAGWGLAWGLVALALPLVALVAASEGRGSGRVEAAIRVTAIAGALGVVALLAASAQAGMFCSNCALTYVLTLAWAAVAFVGLRGSGIRALSGVGLAGGATLAAYLLLLYPGRQTPGDAVRAGEEALRAIGTAGAASGSTGAAFAVAGKALPDADVRLATLLAGLRPEASQTLSDSLQLYVSSPVVPPQPARALTGSPDAPVRITIFTDVLCSHCATLHGTLDYLANVLPAGSFSVDSRQFPLDGNCNEHLAARGEESVRCLAARARICFDTTQHGKEFAGALYQRQRELTPELLFGIAATWTERSDLEECMSSRATKRRLEEDVDYGWRYEPDGTPLVLVNGRRGTSFGPFLYAMVATGGDPNHAALRALPPANPNPHVH